LREAFGPYVRQLNRIQSTDAYSWLPTAISDKRVLTVREGSVIQGVAIFSDLDTVRTIEQIAVSPQHQGLGIGSALIARIELDAANEEIAALELDTAQKMSSLVDLYIRCGFKVIDTGLAEHGRDGYTRVFMRKMVTSTN